MTLEQRIELMEKIAQGFVSDLKMIEKQHYELSTKVMAMLKNAENEQESEGTKNG